MFWPATLVFDHGDAVAPGLAAVWPFAVASALLVVAVVVGFMRWPRGFFPLIAAGILLAPSSSIVPVATQTVAEHRIYLPSACIIGSVVTAVAAAVAASHQRRRLLVVVGLALAGVLLAETGRTITRNLDFATAATLWEQNLRDCPENDRGLTNLVAALIRERRFEEAEPLAAEAAKRYPHRDRNWLNLGRLMAEAGRDDEAVAAFTEAARLAPAGVDARINRAIVLSRGQRVNEAIQELDTVIARRPDIAKGWLARGLAYLRSGQPGRAVADLEMAVQLDPENPAGMANLEAARAAQATEER